MKAAKWIDRDGDQVLGLRLGSMTVFAVENGPESWTVNFGITAEINGYDWMDTLTGRGAFATMRLLRPALELLIGEIEAMGHQWTVICDSRRAKLYLRYISPERIRVAA